MLAARLLTAVATAGILLAASVPARADHGCQESPRARHAAPGAPMPPCTLGALTALSDSPTGPVATTAMLRSMDGAGGTAGGTTPPSPGNP